MAVVRGNIAQSSIILLVLLAGAGVRSWLTPTRLYLSRFREMVQLGLPL